MHTSTDHERVSSSLRRWVARLFGMSIIIFTLGVVYGEATMTPTRTALLHADAVWARPTTSPRPTAKPVARPKNAALCLAQNIFFEAYNEPIEGQLAVAAVVFNRMNSGLFPKTVCGVVYQRYQFSWTIDQMRWSVVPPKEIMKLSQELITNTGVEPYSNALYFHASTIHPAWADDLVLLFTIGNHVFYGVKPTV